MLSIDVFPRHDYRPLLAKGDRAQESGGNKAYVYVYLFWIESNYFTSCRDFSIVFIGYLSIKV